MKQCIAGGVFIFPVYITFARVNRNPRNYTKPRCASSCAFQSDSQYTVMGRVGDARLFPDCGTQFPGERAASLRRLVRFFTAVLPFYRVTVSIHHRLIAEHRDARINSS